MNLSVKLGRLRLKNPILAASGTFGYGKEASRYFDLSILGAVVTKSVTLNPRPGHRPPRIVETPAGMLNAIGLANPGIDRFLSEELPFLKETGAHPIVNIAGETVEEFERLASILDETEIDGIELNISCPNVTKSGICFAMDVDSTLEVVSAVRRKTGHFLITKLSPNVTDIRPFVRAACSGGTDAISLTNTYLAMALDWRRRKPILSNVTGGLSGPAIKPLSLRFLREAFETSSVPLIGIGGIISAEDVLEFIVAGATAVEIGTGNFLNPLLPKEILADLERLLQEEGIENISELTGTLET